MAIEKAPNKLRALTIGLTGGIASGKSTVTEYFSALGVRIIDADYIAREVVAPGERALVNIINHFGDSYLQDDGSLNRRKLRTTIAEDATARKWLNNLLHPIIYQRICQQAEQHYQPYTILAIPLLIESQQNYPIDRILVVDSDEDKQLERLCKRDDCDVEQAKKMLQAQLSRKARLAKANDVIVNNSDLTRVKKQVLQLHEKYLTLTTSKD